MMLIMFMMIICKADHGNADHGNADHGYADHGDADHGDVDHGDDNAMAMKPVGGLDEVVRSRSQPLQNYHLAARHDPPQKMFFCKTALLVGYVLIMKKDIA